MWSPDYRLAVCARLGGGAEHLRERGSLTSRLRLTDAVLAIHVLKEDEFPADFWADFREIVTRATDAGTIEETVGAMSDEDVIELSNKIVELYEEVCLG